MIQALKYLLLLILSFSSLQDEVMAASEHYQDWNAYDTSTDSGIICAADKRGDVLELLDFLLDQQLYVGDDSSHNISMLLNSHLISKHIYLPLFFEKNAEDILGRLHDSMSFFTYSDYTLSDKYYSGYYVFGLRKLLI